MKKGYITLDEYLSNERRWEKRLAWVANLRDGEKCDHPGCLSHVSHPCEGCGRIAGIRVHSSEEKDHSPIE